jgi:hypothetical protein
MNDTLKDKKKAIADESQKTRKVREKLVKYWADMEKQVTNDALQETTVEIHQWIARHAPDRVSLKSKNICLFDENQNTAKLSKKVAEFAEQIKIL